MKKFLPIILFVVGIIVVVGAIMFVRSRKNATAPGEETTTLPEVALADRPIASLAPTSDGHWLDFKVEKIKISADSMDYELLYQLPDGRTQGVPGTITLKGQTQIERKLLLGSESSGKFRYDEGVKGGTLTLRFRDTQGKLLAKFSTDFALLSATKTLATSDGKFTATLSTVPAGFFVVMQTFGAYSNPPAEVAVGPYGLFASSSTSLTGSLSLSGAKNIYFSSGTSWTNYKSGDAFSPGIFIGTK
ncbi:Ig-like domain-containing protein [Patescibacteria group bacterium]|nr:Ig-like domain-containing protein [Patescibacteria group bacterium]